MQLTQFRQFVGKVADKWRDKKPAAVAGSCTVCVFQIKEGFTWVASHLHIIIR